MLLVLITAWPAAAEQASTEGTLVSLECERLSLLVGGAFEYPSTMELAARLVPARAGYRVEFSLGGEAAEGQVYPALISAGSAVAGEDGYARVFLVSGDAPGTIIATASCGDQHMTKRLSIVTRWEEEAVVAPPITPPRVEVPADRIEQARERAKGLYDPRVSVRTEAKHTLLGMGQAAVSALMEVLTDASAPWDVRSLASRTLAEIRDESSRISLAWALRHPAGAIRYSSSAGLKGITDPRVLALVEGALKSDSPGVRSSAMELMVTLPGGGGKVLPCLEDADVFVRARAAWEIAQLDDSDMTAKLNEPGRGLFDEDICVRHAALRGLAAAKTEVLHPGVVAALAHPDGGIRAAAVAAAGRAWEDKLNEVVAGDRDPRVRRSLAFVAAYLLRPSRALPIARALVDDEDESVRRTARRAITAKGSFEDTGLLVKLLLDSEVERTAEHALQRITLLDFGYDRAESDDGRRMAVAAWIGWYAKGAGVAEGREAVWKAALKKRDSVHRGRAAVELVRCKAGIGAEDIRPLLMNKYWENRVFGAEALYLAGDEDAAVNALLDAVKSDRYDERQGVLRAALEVNDAGLVPVFIAALDDPVRAVREKAIGALRIVAGRQAAFDPSATAIERQRAIRVIREQFGMPGADE